MKQPIFIAHRGAWKTGRRENTAGAIERAAASGRFAYIEFDVRRTRSDDDAVQTPILIHDPTLDRLYELYNIPKSKRHRLGQPVHSLTLDIIRSEEIEVSTLAEAMRAAKGHPINMEIKSQEAVEPILEVVGDIIDKYDEWSWEKIVFQSFDWDALFDIKEKAPEAGISMLYGWRTLPRSFGRTYHTLGARWIKFNKWLAPLFSPLAKLYGIPHVAVYTVNSKFGVMFLRLFGVKTFTTDAIKLPDDFPQAS